MTTQTPPKLEELLKVVAITGDFPKEISKLGVLIVTAEDYKSGKPWIQVGIPLEAFIKKVYEAGKPTETNISQLRTWINEKPKDRLVTNEDIKMWLEL